MGCASSRRTVTLGVLKEDMSGLELHSTFAYKKEKEKPTRLNRWNYHDEVRHPGIDHPSVQRVIKVCGI